MNLFKRRSLQLAAFLSVSVLVVACIDREQVTENPQFKTQGLELDRDLLAEKYPTYDEQLVKIAEIVPGFAGVFYNDDNTLTIATVTPVLLPVVQSAVATILGDEFLDVDAKLLEVDYSILELAPWRITARQLFDEPGMISLDIDEVRNRIVVGVDDLDRVSAFEQKLTEFGVPLKAVLFERDEVPELGADGPMRENNHLREVVAPTAGGLQILQPNGTYTCTMGFNAEYSNGVEGFVTNSHCSLKYFLHDAGGTFRQPANPGYAIGTEYYDPPAFSGSGCIYSSCRYSDSTFIAYNNSTSSRKEIAITEKAVLNNYTMFEIDRYWQVDGRVVTTSGSQVNKIGMKTDHSSGGINKTCKDIEHPTKDYMLCQVLATYHHAKGDSGSPVFGIGSVGVDLFGLHWGGTFNGNVSAGIAYFSPMNNVLRDLGGFDYTF